MAPHSGLSGSRRARRGCATLRQNKCLWALWWGFAGAYTASLHAGSPGCQAGGARAAFLGVPFSVVIMQRWEAGRPDASSGEGCGFTAGRPHVDKERLTYRPGVRVDTWLLS